jgi:hypothetical protein
MSDEVEMASRHILLEEMARTFFVLAWADALEEVGKTFPQMDLREVAPPTTEGAFLYAEGVLQEIERANGIDLGTFIPPGMTEESLIRGKTTEDLGYYLAMESLGHGVSWSDEYLDHGLTIPYVEDYPGDSVIDRSVEAVKAGLDPNAYLEEDDFTDIDVDSLLKGLGM